MLPLPNLANEKNLLEMLNRDQYFFFLQDNIHFRTKFVDEENLIDTIYTVPDWIAPIFITSTTACARCAPISGS